MTVAILMPAHNEGERLTRTVDALRARAAELGGATVFVVDDGSEPPVDPRPLGGASGDLEVVLARHAVNLGQGAALETARQLALACGRGFDAYVMMDSDGQHDVDGAIAVVRAVEGGADVAFGNRFLGGSRVPGSRRALLFAARLFEWALTGLRLADAHNGLRGFRRRALQALRIRQNGMAHATEITLRVSRASSAGELVVVEVPVSICYTAATLAKGQRASGALAILRDLLLDFLFREPEGT